MSGKFTSRQLDVYNSVLAVQVRSSEMACQTTPWVLPSTAGYKADGKCLTLFRLWCTKQCRGSVHFGQGPLLALYKALLQSTGCLVLLQLLRASTPVFPNIQELAISRMRLGAVWSEVDAAARTLLVQQLLVGNFLCQIS